MSHYEIRSQALQEQPTAVGRATVDVAGISGWLGLTYGAVFSYLGSHGMTPAGPPFARFHFVDEGRCEAEAGVPVPEPIEGKGDVIPSVLPGGLAAATLHVGPYEAMEPAYKALTSWVDEQGGETTGDAWEVYFTDPQEEPDPAKWKTEVVLPYRETSNVN